jgi:hypothetical protein
MPLEIRLIEEPEYGLVNDFFNRTRNINGPVKKRVRKYNEFYWEFLGGAERRAIFAGAWDCDEGKEPVIVGIQCFIVHKMVASEGKCVLAAKGEDALIDINALIRFKNRDILKALSTLLIDECRKAGVEFLWGFNNLPATYKRLGFETPFKSFNRVLVLDPVKAYRHVKSLRSEHTVSGKLKIAFLSALSYLFSFKRIFLTVRKKGFHIDHEVNDNTGLFQRAVFPQHLFFLLQDKEYLQWRIAENPYPVKYRSYQLLDQGNILHAQVICSIQDNTAFIEQTLQDKNLDRKVLNFLLKEILRSLKNENVFLVRFTGYNNNILNRRETNLMKNMGFVLTGNGEWFTFKTLSENPVVVPGNIYFSRMYKQGRT